MIDTKYNHHNVEQNKYEKWKSNDYFKSGDLSKKPFTIVIPPPNITGKLHLGHAWDTTLQDIIIRYKRMCGYDALWLPGMDHAGIATQSKIDKKLKEQGINPRELDREEWLKIAWDWKKEYASSIHEQWATLGLSLDYSKERFTLDENLSNAVRHVFITLYNKNYIYRGERIINWDPLAMTALSNEEVIYKDIEGTFYHLKYKIEDSNDYLEIATTRPETLFGDTAVAVNPDDDRYKNLIGKNVVLPVVNKLIPIIADEYADPSFGTGVVKITPAHDPNDFEVGNRHNLDRIQVMNANGTMNEKAFKYQGLDRFECRKLLVEDLKKQNLLIKTDKIKHSVGHSERTDTMIEPYLSKQWFVRMCTLSQQVLDIQKTNGKVNFIPKRFEKILIHWMENCHDWCISRQLWWGHRIPAWYKDDEVFVGENSPGEGWVQDNDVLDTWFSSALWPFSTLGWPQETDDYKRYYPTNCLVTGYDIIFFWVCRMIFQGLEFTKQVPFNDVLIHGLIRDKDGRKMSKSLGNGIDPMEIIEKYGCDSLRYYLTTTVSAGMDLRFEEDKIKSTWNFINKLWNASRFVFMNITDIEIKPLDKNEFSISDKWILTKLNKTIKSVTKHMEKYEFNLVGKILYNFIWDDFCDWYIELSKIDMNNTTKNVLIHVLSQILKMLHPFMPFVTEEIYSMLPNSNESIMISSYPIYNKEHVFENQHEQEEVIELIKKIRKIKTDNNINEFTMVCSCNLVNNNKECFIKMTKANLVDSDDNLKKLEKIGIEVGRQKIDIFYDNADNKEKEIANFKILKEKLIESIDRRKKLLSNENYVKKAPKQVVEKDKEMLYKEEQELKSILKKLS